MTAALLAVGVAAGTAVGFGQYHGAAQDRTTAVAAPVPLPTARPTVVRVEVEPCEPGWTLKHGSCVRVVRKLVPVAVPAPVPATPRSTPTPVRRAPAAHETEHESDDDHEHESDDDHEHEDDHEQDDD